MSDSSKLAEQAIREAMQNGAFDDLEGAGKPLDLDEPPAGVSRDAWQLMKILKEANILPEEVVLLRQVHDLKKRVESAGSPREKAELTAKLRRLELETQIKLETFAKKWPR